ncbi:hypothetical protein PPYR_06935 [Photinus pyralis]|uniref:2'-phosphotransferase n=1 Tax=Photinus pyralis TaxID=7054 RepID=A0A1Y1K8Y2_PHOPY|nr:tRNA 2'-phosphotransferase 1 [Photinus pyralis]KAB0799055.1 hypothetical protein PPYR_06935 [Photinus pyralis]
MEFNRKSTITKDDVRVSKRLSWLLRHGALNEGLHLSTEGFIPLQQILESKGFESVSISDIERIVLNNDKQRFTLRTSETGILEIKANQGHSIDVRRLELTPLTDPKKVQNVIHGTYFQFWKCIKKEGLFRGKRMHIHFSEHLPGAKNISGIRASAEIFIYVDLAKALSQGLKFYISPNNVILSPGNEQGYVKPDYFMKVCRASDGHLVDV